DVEAALLAGAKSVDAVEIDPAILKLSEKFSPSNIYHDPRVHVHVEDARTFLQRTGMQYDAVIFGFLDSQNLFSYGSNLRLDGYIYTVECFARAFDRVRDGGLMSVSFSVPQDWVAEKLARMLQQASGTEPIVYQFRRQYVLLVPKFEPKVIPQSEQMFVRADSGAMLQSRWPLASDDWPYLYLSRRGVPIDYCIVIAILLILSAAGVLTVRKSVQIDLPDAHFFFLGAGFLLLQTKSIQDCSLYFGTTWLVSMIVISGTLLMILAANLLAMRLRSTAIWAYLPLLASVLALQWIDRHAVLAWPLQTRLAWAILVVPLPIFFAGLIFSTTFRNANNPSACFGANLIGATVGGFCEYLGMWIGISALSWLVIAAYLASACCVSFAKGRSRIRTDE
ncbi:MAG TPA: hypothetical protein VKK61_10495, partial [Tepidisphaeraceae bacterium]|nr:hypothetical protein [Tepidisphaeraceae bacterium]